jgi:hypothetical protein
MLRNASLAAVSVLGACTSGPPANSRLADLGGVSMSLDIWRAQNDETTEGYIYLNYDIEAFRATHGECAVLGDFSVSMPGARVVSKSRGSDDEDFDDCYAPSMALEIPNFGDSDLTSVSISDESLTIDATFAPGVLAPRIPALRSPSTWKFAGAQEVVLGWSHPADLVDGAEFLDAPVYFHTNTGDDPNYFDVVSTLSGDEIRFRIPDPPAILGRGYIIARFGYETGEAQTCSGATRCGYSVERGYAHSVEIVARTP